MKIIFSRKGFDSTRRGSESPNGGVPSPIFPDGTALSLPIPQPGSRTRYGDVQWRCESIGPIVESLTNRRRKDGCHLDPDLNADALERLPGWRPAFGQSKAAQSQGGWPRRSLSVLRVVSRRGTGEWGFLEVRP